MSLAMTTMRPCGIICNRELNACERWTDGRICKTLVDLSSRHPWYVALYMVVAIAAAAMRFWELGVRAFHHDESLHAFYSWNLYAGEGYIHNPMMHGPFQMEATAGLFFLFGDTDYTARLLYAIAGTALVLMPILFRSRLGDWGALFTSMMLAFSPAMLYYSRFARNDILMAVWALAIVIAMWRYLGRGRRG